MKFGAGRSTQRLEDARLVRGAGQFVDDLAAGNALRMAILRSPHAHALIRSIATQAAAERPGVIAVATGEDLAAAGLGPMPFLRSYTGPDGKPMRHPPRWALARERVRHVGEPVAAIVATSLNAALDALDAIEIEFEIEEAVIGLPAALAENAALVWPEAGTNAVVKREIGDRAAVDAVFTQAAHVVELDVTNQRVHASPLEPRGVLARPDGERMVLHTASQNPTAVQDALVRQFQWPEEKLRLLVPEIGGGFGMKGYLYPEDVLALWFAERLAMPVRWNATRTEEFTGATHGRDQIARGALAFDADGRILALRLRTHSDLGAYPSPPGPLVATVLGTKVITNVYDIPAVDIEAHGVLTHTQPTAPYRGAGRPEAIFFIERLMDEAAVRLGIDRAEIRRRNLVQPASIPYRTATGEVYDSGNFPALLDLALEKADWQGFDARRRQSAAAGRLRGQGLAMFVEWTGANAYKETVDISVLADGTLEVVSATQPMGQGLETSFAQMVGAVFDVDPHRVRLIFGDTDRARGFGSFGSRSLITGGSAVVMAAQALVERCKEHAAEALEAASADIEIAEGELRIVGTDRGVRLSELAARAPLGRIGLVHSHEIASGSWPNGAYACEVEIDPETGVPTIERFIAVDDVGVVINPLIVHGQIQGGVAQGLGQALLEQLVYAPESGQLVTASFQDYCMPRADDVPSVDTWTDERWPCRTNALGSKGVGESGTVGATPVVISAILDALRAAGVTGIDMPATPHRIWERLREACSGN